MIPEIDTCECGGPLLRCRLCNALMVHLWTVVEGENPVSTHSCGRCDFMLSWPAVSSDRELFDLIKGRIDA